MLPAHAKLLFSILNAQLLIILRLGKQQPNARQIKCFLGKTERNHKLEFLLPYVLRLTLTITKLLFGLKLKALNLKRIRFGLKTSLFMCWKDYKQHRLLLQLVQHFTKTIVYTHVKQDVSSSECLGVNVHLESTTCTLCYRNLI